VPLGTNYLAGRLNSPNWNATALHAKSSAAGRRGDSAPRAASFNSPTARETGSAQHPLPPTRGLHPAGWAEPSLLPMQDPSGDRGCGYGVPGVPLLGSSATHRGFSEQILSQVRKRRRI